MIPVINMTKFFNKELFLYSIGDLRMPKPVSIRKAGMFLGAIAAWTLPLMIIFNFPANLLFWVVALSVPLLFATVADMPFFGGRSVIEAAAVSAKYISRPHNYADFKATNIGKSSPRYTVDQEMWISRRRELMELADQMNKEFGR